MRWTGLHITNYQQFEDFDLDFTDPKTGEPLEKVCFIGGNGTGKTTLLRILFLDQPKEEILAASFRKDEKDFLAGGVNEGFFRTSAPFILSSQEDRYFTLRKIREYDREHNPPQSPANGEMIVANPEFKIAMFRAITGAKISSPRVPNYPYELIPLLSFDLSVFAQADSNLAHLAQMDLPPSILAAALALSPAKGPARHIINAETVSEFWTLLIYHIKRRENAYSEFRRLPENRRRIVEDVDREFEDTHPDILRPLAELWSEILDAAGLVFDYEKAKLPVQLTDNLEAYIHLKGSGEKLAYHQLSTGIRLFLFRLGHIFALFYNQTPASSLVIVDEPENSLFVDLQRKLVSLYQKAAPGAQLFMATHSPLIAAQFKPEERFILEFDPDRPGKVIARRGVAPEGDDPNDVLRQDFGMDEVMSEAGVLAWEKYQAARRKMMRNDITEEEREKAAADYHKLGRDYHFPARNTPSR